MFDPVLSQYINDESFIFGKSQVDSGFVCSHCYSRIFGKVHRIGNDFFDTYCYSMRYILGYEVSRRERPDEKPSGGMED